MYLGMSVKSGKEAIKTWIQALLSDGHSILDIGAGGGTYRDLLDKAYWMEAVEVYPPAWPTLLLKYDVVYGCDIRHFQYQHRYNMVIMGDVLEHLAVEDAQQVLDQAMHNADVVLVAVPFEYPQDEIDGNKAEIHLQPDLNFEIMQERYPQLQLLLYTETDNEVFYDNGDPFHVRYAYYYAKGIKE